MADQNVQVHGTSFPFRVDPWTGRIAVSSGSDKLRENVVHLLLTRIGERPMLRDYGGGVTQLLQENINEGLVAIARHQMVKAMLQYEPRVLPQEVSVLEVEPGVVQLRVLYLEATRPGVQQAIIPVS